MNLICALLFLVGFQLSYAEELNCEFKDVTFEFVGSSYSCFVSSLENPNNNMIIHDSTGLHKPNKNDKDVRAIWIHKTNTKYIPTNLGYLFNLTTLIIWHAQLIAIKARDFDGMQNLEYLSLWSNALTSVSVDVFSTLKKSKYISLSENQIQEIPNGLFDFNLNLEKNYFYKNQIQFISTELFDNLKNLNRVDLGTNICLSKNYEGASTITQLKKDIKQNCKNPFEEQLNKMEKNIRNLEKELLEATGKLLESKNGQQKEQQEKIKVLNVNENELSKVIDKHKMDQSTINYLINEQQKDRSEINKLKNKLTQAKEKQHRDQLKIATIQSRNDELENDLDEIYSEMFDGEQCDGI